jgi:glycosyltransferase 2 family protein
LIYALITAVLVALVYVQFRTWRDFDWATFWSQTDHVHPLHILAATVLIYLAYVMRAIRWKIFLRPVRRDASTMGLVAPTVIGFTGLAMLGRPGELIRPYLIARKENLPFSSQLAVWAVERIFDIGAFTLLLIVAIFFAAAPKQLAYYKSFRDAGFVLVALVIAMTVGAIVIGWKGEDLADWVERRFFHLAAQRIALRIREFRGGLNTIHSASSLLQLIIVSVVMWYLIALAYQEVVYSYGLKVLQLPVSQILLLMGSSMLGSLIQLPGVGGGSQLATIAALEHVFDAPHELAASCGILLWLVTFVAVVPLGLALAHRERLSLRKLSKESEKAEASAVVPSSPPAA